MTIAVVFVAWLTAIGGLLLVGRHMIVVRRSRERVFAGAADEALTASAPDEDSSGVLRTWLLRAGYRGASAPTVFLGLSAAGALTGVFLVLAVYRSGVIERGVELAGRVPGGVGDLMLPVIYVGPWFVLAVLAGIPTLLVRGARRQRVSQVEEDLPITLELLATLSEAGLGFDAALERILGTQPTTRALSQECRALQVDILAGRPRIQCLRRLSWRLDVLPLTIFVSALVQSEQVGAGVSDVLRRQADDLRNRRRENALALASTLPVKLLFPLVICFMPGVLVATLGPTFYQIFQFLDNLSRR